MTSFAFSYSIWGFSCKQNCTSPVKGEHVLNLQLSQRPARRSCGESRALPAPAPCVLPLKDTRAGALQESASEAVRSVCRFSKQKVAVHIGRVCREKPWNWNTALPSDRVCFILLHCCWGGVSLNIRSWQRSRVLVWKTLQGAGWEAQRAHLPPCLKAVRN